jgi:hypothetical protein
MNKINPPSRGFILFKNPLPGSREKPSLRIALEG